MPKEPAVSITHKRNLGRTLMEFLPLSRSEEYLLNACKNGDAAIIGADIPQTDSNNNSVRATFLRYLLLGGCSQISIHDRGVHLVGAVVSGDLDLYQCHISMSFCLQKCIFSGSICAIGAKVTGSVILDGSHVAEDIVADGIIVGGNIYMRNNFSLKNTLRLTGVKVGGDISLDNGNFASISLARSVINGNVSLRGNFHSTGIVSFDGSTIANDLICTGIINDSECKWALSLVNSKIGNKLILCLGKPIAINCDGANVGTLSDSMDSWGKGTVLNGFQYMAFGLDTSTDANERIDWLYIQADQDLGKVRAQNNRKPFKPQPWHQLKRVLVNMGHAQEAKQVGIAFEKLKHIAGASKYPHLHRIFGLLADYGYSPMKLVGWMALVWLLCGIAFWTLALPPFNAIGPSDPLVFQNPAYAHCAPKDKETGSTDAYNWYLCEKLPAEYSTFSPMMYSLDILLPLVDLGQEKYWGALVNGTNENWQHEMLHLSTGHWVRFLVWFETLFGWMASLLLVSVVSGFARRTEE